jgi:hypothetical protein
VKRALFVAIPLMVALASIVTVSTAMLSFPAGAQQALDAYLQHVRAAESPHEGLALQADLIVRASRPWELSPQLDFPALGDTWYFHADRRYTEPIRPSATPFWHQYFAYNSETSAPDDRPAPPFPAQEVWCVRLLGQPADRVVFVARHHREPYYTEWITHQGPDAPFNQEFLQTLSALGCDLELAP